MGTSRIAFWVFALMCWTDSGVAQLDGELRARFDNTIVVWTSDNGPEEAVGWHGTAGFWRGNYFTALEGSLRTSFLIRWPGKIRAGSVNNEIVHITDMLPTFSSVAGYDVPDDRQIDGIDQIDFFLGKQKESNREGFPVYWGDTLECTAAAGWVSTKGETSDTD